jgi:dephospho-CoA kinase
LTHRDYGRSFLPPSAHRVSPHLARNPLPAVAPRSRPLIVGILGGIASGKSAAAAGLAGDDGWVVSADRLATEELDSPEGVRFLRERFGPGLVDASGRPDRNALAALAFDPGRGAQARAWLEGWIHPRVRARIKGLLEDARAAAVPIVVLDVPLLLENDESHGLARGCDALVFVESDEAERESRARTSREWQPGEIRRREAVQLPLATKRARAHHVLQNQGNLDELGRAARELRERLLRAPVP